ncbi:MAG: transposase, partial [Chloroflexi bacterium]|nr:transposase [Chloroflexota bacterium]
HPWLEAELTAILATLPEPPAQTEAERRATWQRWQAGLTVRFTLPDRLPPLRLLLVLDNLSGHKTPSLVLWLVAHGVMPLYTPLSATATPSAAPAPSLVGRSIADLPHSINGDAHAK